MALSDVKTYFRAQIASANPLLREWKDGFNINNIPSTIYDKAYHLSYGQISGDELGAEHQGISVNFVVRLFFKGFRDVSSGIDVAVDVAESVIKQVQDPADRLGLEVKNVKFLDMSIEESFVSNDNLILVTQNYLVTKYFCLGE